MAREIRDYAGGAVDTTLSAGINSTDLSISIADATGWPTGGANGPFFIVVSYDITGKEKIEVASRTGTTLTVASTAKRGVDGTSAASHASGAKVRHCITAQDHDEFNSHAFDITQDDHTQYLNTTRHDTTGRHTVGSVVPAGTPGAIAPDDTAAAGVANSVARSDHRHAIVAAPPTTIQPDDSTLEGAATSFARSDHRHAIFASPPVAVGTANSEGTATSFARSDHVHSSLITIVVFASSGTWNKPSGLRYVRVRVVGGGGGSGGAANTGGNAASAGGGGGGGYAEEIIDAASLGSTETVTVGAGGAAGVAGNFDGGSGGTTSFGVHLSATGGGGGEGGGAASDAVAGGGTGGAGAGGHMNMPGSEGGLGVVSGGISLRNGDGGASLLGAVRFCNTKVSAAGAAGNNYGGGAAGAINGASSGAKAGGAGAGGIVIVEEFR